MTTDTPSFEDDYTTTDSADPTQAQSDDGGSDTAGQSAPVDVPAGSRLADLFAERDERLEKEELRLPVPTFKGALVAVFRPMTIEERKSFAKRQQAGKADEVSGGAQFIAEQCVGLEFLDESGDYLPVLHADGTQARMDVKFAHARGWTEIVTDGGCVQKLVNWNVASVEGLFEKIYLWSQDTSAEIEGAILGE